jgi:hypothetical protein
VGLVFLNNYHAQEGGKKRERRGRKRGNLVLTQYKSHGHADEFARGSSGRKGRFARLFSKKKQSPWVYKKSGTKRSHWKANQFLFTRTRSKGKIENAQYLDVSNKERSKTRIKGNRAFRFRKYQSR